MIRISEHDVLLLHSQLIQETGGEDGVRDYGLLDSAVQSPWQTFGGVELYPTTIEKTARLAFSLVKNHPFVDGNKRIGALVMLLLLELNAIEIYYTQEELVEFFFRLADKGSTHAEIMEWIYDHLEKSNLKTESNGSLF